ncbi:hypothetical protein MRX96_022567 [Rhipicephalus microplus]
MIRAVPLPPLLRRSLYELQVGDCKYTPATCHGTRVGHEDWHTDPAAVLALTDAAATRKGESPIAEGDESVGRELFLKELMDPQMRSGGQPWPAHASFFTDL